MEEWKGRVGDRSCWGEFVDFDLHLGWDVDVDDVDFVG